MLRYGASHSRSASRTPPSSTIRRNDGCAVASRSRTTRGKAEGRGRVADFHVYVGLGGDTDSGRFLSSGLYRSHNGEGRWESIGERITPTPQVRAILTDPGHPGRVTIGTQDGVWRSEDCGDTWRRLSAPSPGLAVWSLSRHPHHSETIFAGYEPCAIVRSVDDGASWETLPVEATFPDITMRPEPMPKRVLGVAVDPTEPEATYACLEIGGLLRSLDWGRTWTNVVDGLYVNEDSVNLHSVVVSPTHAGAVTVASRIGAD